MTFSSFLVGMISDMSGGSDRFSERGSDLRGRSQLESPTRKLGRLYNVQPYTAASMRAAAVEIGSNKAPLAPIEWTDLSLHEKISLIHTVAETYG